MKKWHTQNLTIGIILFFSIHLFSSCASTKNTKYYQDIPDSGQLKIIAKAEYIEPRIEIDDILTIVLQTVDPQASAMVNAGNISSNSNTPAPLATSMSTVNSPSSNSTSSLGYLVDKQGNVTIPVLGSIKVVGLTTTQARQVILSAADHFFKDPSVIVRFANFKVNVGGEVLRPGTYTMPNEKVSILDAISMAGDLTVFGKRDNVLLIRENPDGTRTPYRINLKKSDFMSSPYFYLRQNDYIYVEPDKGKAAATDAASARNYTILASVLTIIIVLVSRIK
jgi:polysaccharide export outer membrane protein